MKKSKLCVKLAILHFLCIFCSAKRYNILDFGAIPDDPSINAAFKNSDAFLTALTIGAN